MGKLMAVVRALSVVSLAGGAAGSNPPEPAPARVAEAAAAAGAEQVPAPGAVRRVGGAMDAKVEVTIRKDPKAGAGEGAAGPGAASTSGATSLEEFRCGASRIDTPLPVGYPFPTPPGAIDVKTYPGVRRAEFTGTVRADVGMNLGFWPLFQHIQRRNIAMTSPVEMDLPGLGAAAAEAEHKAGRDVGEAAELTPQNWTMSILYRTPNLGATGEDGKVKIVDRGPMTVLALGFTGAYGTPRVERGLRELEAWLAGQQLWERAGEPRALYYNGPDVPNRDKWGEVQVPVRLRGAAESGEGGKAKGGGDGAASQGEPTR